MNQIERRGWLIVVVIFFTIFLVSAGYHTQSLFFTPILRTFGWSRAKLASLTALINIALALGSLPVGWLLDRIAARMILIVGIAVVGASFLLASHAHSYPALVIADLIMGFGLAACWMVPGAYLVANWMDTNRALALAVIANGSAIGGMMSNLIVSRLIAAFGWRAAYVLMTLPLFLVMIPVVALVVRNRPRPKPASAASATPLPGLEVREAMAGRSFWLIVVLCPALYGFAANGILLHLVPSLISLGYAPRRAALAIAMLLGFAGVVKLGLGTVADRTNGRLVLSTDLMVFGLGFICLLFERNPLMVVLFVIAGGSSGAPAALFPFVTAEAMGLRRFGMMAGIASWAIYFGGVGGMIGGGWIFDRTGSYHLAFTVYMGLAVLSGLGVLAVQPFKARQLAAGEVRLAGIS